MVGFIVVRPFVKWVGGKKQLLNIIEDNLPDNVKSSKKIDKYFECFVGGGALYFHLVENYHIKKSYLYDINSELILTYKVIQSKPKDLIEKLNVLQEDYYSQKDQEDKRKYYLNIRKTFNEKANDLLLFDFSNKITEDHVERASYIIFMNKTCFNGLFRLNQNGEFNVPHGKYKNPLICDKENILAVSQVLKNTTILNTDYYDAVEVIDKDSLVYLDPPYRPLSDSSSFTNYDGYEFKDKDQIRLGSFYEEISDKGAYVILSNSDPKNTNPKDNFFDDLYSNYTIQRVKAKRSINSNGDGRGKINEILVTNY